MASDYIASLRDRVAGWLASGLEGNNNGDDVETQSMATSPRSQAAVRSGWTRQGESSLCDALRVESFEGAQVGWEEKGSTGRKKGDGMR